MPLSTDGRWLSQHLPYADCIQALRNWNSFHNVHSDAYGFLEFIGSRSFNKVGDKSYLSAYSRRRVQMLLSPHWRALLKAHMIREGDA